MPKLMLNLDSNEFLGLDALDRYLKMAIRLRDAGFKFTAIDDLFPAAIDLEQPYTMDVDGPKVTFVQSTVQ